MHGLHEIGDGRGREALPSPGARTRFRIVPVSTASSRPALNGLREPLTRMRDL
jgi:hypothetical protein